MPLNLDRSRALRTSKRQLELVEAVRDAPLGTQETHAVEWKREGDPKAKPWRVKLALGVLGFANRDPDGARGEFEGCAYLLIGVEPGLIRGTPRHDAADVETWLGEYVGKGADGPEWSPNYVRADEAWVLVITIEPPRNGSRIWTLRKDYSQGETEAQLPLREGTIFIRRGSKTVQANSAEVEALSKRASSVGKRLEGLSLVVSGSSLASPIDLGAHVLDDWEASRRQATAPDLTKARPAALTSPYGSPIAASKTLAAMQALLAERRSIDEYAAEVDAYIAKGRRLLPLVLRRALLIRDIGRINLSLRNGTDRPFRDVEVVLSVNEGESRAFLGPADLSFAYFPDAPVSFGDLTGWTKTGISRSLLSRSAASPSPEQRGRVDDDGTITLPGIDVRADKVEPIEPFYLQVGPKLAGKAVTAEWRASGTDADGTIQGTISIPVSDSVLPMAQLLDESLTEIAYGVLDDE